MDKLIDTRAKTTPLAHAVIEAHHRADGRDHSEIIREEDKGSAGKAGGSRGRARE